MKTDEQKIEDALRRCDEECEDANYHDRYGLAGQVYVAIEDQVPPENRVLAAKRIAKAIAP